MLSGLSLLAWPLVPAPSIRNDQWDLDWHSHWCLGATFVGSYMRYPFIVIGLCVEGKKNYIIYAHHDENQKRCHVTGWPLRGILGILGIRGILADTQVDIRCS